MISSQKKNLLILLLLICGSQLMGQMLDLDYSGYPIIKIKVQSTGKDLLENLRDIELRQRALVSNSSGIEYIIENVVSDPGSTPDISYYGIKRTGEYIIILDEVAPNNKNYYENLVAEYEELITQYDSVLAAWHASQLPQDVVIDIDTVIIDWKLRDVNNQALDIRKYFKQLNLLPLRNPDQVIELKLKREDGVDTLFINNSVQKGNVIIDSLNSTLSSEMPPGWCNLSPFLNDDLEMIRTPAIIYLVEKDTCLFRIITENLNELTSVSKDLIGLHLIHSKKYREILNNTPFKYDEDLDKLREVLNAEQEKRTESLSTFELSPIRSELLFELTDSLSIPLGKDSTLNLVINVPESILLSYYMDKTCRDIRDEKDIGNFIKAAEILEASRLECASREISTVDLEEAATSLFDDFYSFLASESAVSFDTLVFFKKLWKGSPVKSYNKKVLEQFNKEFDSFKLPESSTALISYCTSRQAELDKALSPLQEGALAYARFIVNRKNRPITACKNLSIAKKNKYRYIQADDNSFCNNLLLSGQRDKMLKAYDEGNFAEAYKIGTSNRSIYNSSPSHRLMLAVSARKTGNLREAYTQYIWFDKNWTSLPEGELDYDEYLEILKELSFSIGSFQKSAALFEASYLNSSKAGDLTMAIISHRTFYIKIISDFYVLVSNKTQSSTHLPYYEKYKPVHVSSIKVFPKGQNLKAIYPANLKAFPFHIYDDKSRMVFSLDKNWGGGYLEISQKANLFSEQAKPLVDKLSQTGYDGKEYNELIQIEKEENLRFLGMTIKSLTGDLYTQDSGAFKTRMEKLVKENDIFSYIEYGTHGGVKKIGKCPPAEAYSNKQYLQKYKTIINYENTSLSYSKRQIDEIAVPLKEKGKRIGYIRFGLILGDL